MNETSYTKSFIISCILILGFIIGTYYFGNIFLEKAAPKVVKETIITLDMDQYKVQGNDKTKPISDPGGSSAPKKTVKPKPVQDVQEQEEVEETQDVPYVGGTEESEDVDVAAAADQGNVSETGTGISGEGTSADEGEGTGNGGKGSGSGSGDSVGSGENGGNGYVDLAGYIAKLNSIKQYPAQAVRRNLTGSVAYSVTFSPEGDVVSTTLLSSSGYSVLDRATYRLIMRGGRIINTTGKSATRTVVIKWHLN